MISKGFARSREQANSLLMSGNVFVNGKRVEKSGQQVLIESSIEVKEIGPDRQRLVTEKPCSEIESKLSDFDFHI